MTTADTTKHTPGPWQHAGPYDSCEQPECQYVVTDGDGRTLIAEVNGEENARLVAAAPEAMGYLAALLKSLSHPSLWPMLHDYEKAKVRQAETLVTRVTGEKM